MDQAHIRSMTLSDYTKKKLFEDNADIYNCEKMEMNKNRNEFE